MSSTELTPAERTTGSTITERLPVERLKGGAPVTIQPDVIWPAILAEIEGGRSLTEILTMPGLPSRQWAMQCLRKNPALRQQYEEACKSRAILMADEILTIADAPIPEDLDPACRASHVALRRLQVDVRRWATGKLYPKYFGDKVGVEVTGYQSISIIDAMAPGLARAKEMHARMLAEQAGKPLDVESRVVQGSPFEEDQGDATDADDEMNT